MTVCFIHIPKTAGTSVMQTLSDAVGKNAVYWVGHERPHAHWLDGTKGDFSNFRVVGGHVSAHELRQRIDRVSLIASLIRHPVDRALSYYDFVVNHPDGSHHLMSELRELGLERALTESKAFIGMVADSQCRMLGHHDYRGVLAEIDRGAMIIETVENGQRCLDAMAAALHLPRRPLPHLNRGRPGYATKLSDATRKRIRDLNPNDLALYNEVRSRRGLFRFMPRRYNQTSVEA